MSLPTPHLDRRMPAAFAAALILVVLVPCIADAEFAVYRAGIGPLKDRRRTVPPSRRGYIGL